MRPAENIKKLIEKAKVKIDPDVKRAALEKLFNELEKSKRTTSAETKPSVWRIIMKSRMIKLAAAAVIIIAVLIGVNQFGGSIDGANVVWADVVKKIDQVKDYAYRQRRIDSSGVIPTGFEFKSEVETLWYYSSEFGTRWDQYHAGKLSGQYFVQLKKQQTIWINLSEKTYSCRAEQFPSTRCLDPRSTIRQIIVEPHIKLGRKMINGVMAEGIEVQGQKVACVRLDNAVSRIWVDVETSLPVYLETEGKIHGSDTYGRVIEDQFQWNVNLTEADFTPHIADYTQKDWPVDNAAKWNEVVAAYTTRDTKVDFTQLEELGLLYTEEAPEQSIKALTGIDEIHEARDKVMRSWPSYADLRESLQNELNDKLNLESCTVEELVRIGVLLREKFWNAGGCFSPVSYRYGYMARVLLELAYARRSNDLAVGDELAEAIMAVGTMTIPKTEGFSESLLAIRRAQFSQICEEVKYGRKPFWDDFARGCDLAYLSSVREPNEAVAVVDWLIQNAHDGGWEACLDTLKWMRSLAAQGKGLGFNIYYVIKPGFPEEFGFGGRPPSFKGPRSRIIVPLPAVKD